MAVVTSARLVMSLIPQTTPGYPSTGDRTYELNNGTGGRTWTPGDGSGQINRMYRSAVVTLTASETDTYDLLAAGNLFDRDGQAIDLDELKGYFVLCKTGSIAWRATAANYLACFEQASKGIVLPADAKLCIEWGAAGLALSTNSKFDIVDLAGGSGSTYEICFIGSN